MSAIGLAGGEGRLVDKAATAARAFARPRGAVERSETGASEKMVQVRGTTQSLHKAATAARAFARPVGADERREFSVRQDMVEARGHPSNRNQRVGLAGGNPQTRGHTKCVVEPRGYSSNRNRAATAARAFARPRGDVERSETGASEKMVEVRGETSNRNPRVGLVGGNPQTRGHTKCVVEPRGIEPLTSSLRTTRSPN